MHLESASEGLLARDSGSQKRLSVSSGSLHGSVKHLAILTYGVALSYANRVHDHDLSDDTLTLAKMLGDQQLGNDLSPQAKFLLEYDPNSRGYFSISSAKRGLLAGSSRLGSPLGSLAPDALPQLYTTRLDNHDLRAATVQRPSPLDSADMLTITVAETLRDRHQQAREILLLAVLMQTVLILSVLSLVWFGVNHGLRVLNPLTERLARRSHELTPIGGADVPQEILPLTRTIDALFARLRSMLALHDRFIADAAHQLRTPLAGLSLHVDRALADPRPETTADALSHIRRLTHRAARTSSQLLALTRAQASPVDAVDRDLLELTRLIPEAVSLRVHEALVAGVDLGYEGPRQSLYIMGDTASLLDLLDNLIDNSIRYAGRGSTVTVSLQPLPDGGATLSVEDDGPGVPPELLPRLSERFFRAPGSSEEGSGLGLAIVQRIAERHHAEVVYQLGEKRGLVVQGWWRAFNDPQLDALVDRALANNLDVEEAVERLRAVRALHRSAETRYLPSLRARTNDVVEPSANASYQLAGFDASWEFGLFGKAEGSRREARGALDASVADLRIAQVSLVAEVVRDWIEMRTAQQQEQLLLQINASRRREWELLQVRQHLQLVASSVADQAQAALAQSSAALAEPRQTITASAQQLAMLLGQNQPDAAWSQPGTPPELRPPLDLPSVAPVPLP
ncbi:MAG: hypothetical protein WDW38_011497 [Sanguina aurantia]